MDALDTASAGALHLSRVEEKFAAPPLTSALYGRRDDVMLPTAVEDRVVKPENKSGLHGWMLLRRNSVRGDR